MTESLLSKPNERALVKESFLESSDLDQLLSLISSSLAPCELFPHNTGPFYFRCRPISLNGFRIADAHYEGAFSVTIDSPGDVVTVFLPTAGNAVFDWSRQQVESSPECATLVEVANAPLNVRQDSIRSQLSLTIDTQSLRDKLSRMLDRTISGNLGIQPTLDLASSAGILLRELAQSAHRGLSAGGALRHCPLGYNSLVETVGYLLIESCVHRYTEELRRPAKSPTPRHVKWAMEFMEEHIAQPISLDDIAAASKVSPRALQQGFRQFRNTSPTSHLRDLRMGAARQDLLRNDDKISVAEIALKWGFTHLGRFAAEYKKRYGELPSETARR
ncbi:UNVERIFIED_ORG: AraC-like DNA-binding protein [Rhizobium etli]